MTERRPGGEDLSWRPRRVARIGGVAVVALALLLAVTFTAAPPSATGYLPAAVLWVLTAVTAIGVWRGAFRPSITCTPTGLHIRNPGSEAFVPWADIHTVTPGYYGIAIKERTGDVVTAWAVQKPNWATWLHRRTRADDVADAIRRRLPPSVFDHDQ